MADSGFTAVGLGVRPANIAGKLSEWMSLKGQKQAIEGQAAEVASAQQSQRQRADLAKFDFTQFLGEDGTPDLNAMAASPDLAAAAGDQKWDVISKAATVKQQQLEAKSKLIGIRGEQRQAFAELMGGLRGDPDVANDTEQGRQKLNQAMVQYGEMYGEDVLPVLGAYAPQLQKVPKGKLGDALKAIQMQAVSASAQLEKQQPQYMNTGGAMRNINPNTPPGQSMDSIPLTISPGQQDQAATDQLGNPYRQIRDPRGNIVGTAPVPGAGAPGGPAVFGVGERDTFEKQANENFGNITKNREAAGMAPQQLDQINRALDLSKSVNTGHWAQKRSQIESGVASIIPGLSAVQDDATKLQLLDKFAERIATDASRVLGVNATTDAQRESIHRQNANIGYTPEAVQEVLKYAKAQTMAMQSKGDAQESWLKQEGSGITKQHEFETKFRQAYDPRVFQYAVMSPDEKEAYKKGLSKSDRASLAEKAKALKELGVSLSGQ